MTNSDIRSLEDVRVLMRSSENMLRAKEQLLSSTAQSSRLDLQCLTMKDWSSCSDHLRKLEATVLLEFPPDSPSGADLLQDLRILQRRFSTATASLQSEISASSKKITPASVSATHESVRTHVSSFLGHDPTRVEHYVIRGSSRTAFVEQSVYNGLGTTAGSIIPTLIISCASVIGADEGTYLSTSTLESVPLINHLGHRISDLTSALSRVSSSLKQDSIEIAGRKVVESARSILTDLRQLSGRSSSWSVSKMLESIGAAGHLRLQSKAGASDVYRKITDHLRREYGPSANSNSEVSKWVLPGNYSRFVKITVEVDGEFVRVEILNLRSL